MVFMYATITDVGTRRVNPLGRAGLIFLSLPSIPKVQPFVQGCPFVVHRILNYMGEDLGNMLNVGEFPQSPLWHVSCYFHLRISEIAVAMDDFQKAKDEYMFALPEEADLTPIWITIFYDPALQLITGKAKAQAMVNRGCPFGFILTCLLMDYPQIERLYPPGVLGFTLNGQPPEMSAPLADGDQLCFMVCDDLPFAGLQ